MVDFAFYTLYVLYAAVIGWVLYRYRSEPLYDPRILFSLAASLWLFILHGYLNGFEGYLAARPGFYSRDIRELSAIALGLMLVGYCVLIAGASLGTMFSVRPAQGPFRDRRLLVFVCLLLIFVAFLNFMVNVMLISGGNVVGYLFEFALRSSQVADNKGITASGYLLGFIGVQVIAYVAGRRNTSRKMLIGLLSLFFLMLMIRFSQARIFQTLVLIGACYVSYSMGAARRDGRHLPWIQHFHYLVITAFLGVGFYFLRVASALNRTGVRINWETVWGFGDRIVHFAFERGNVPNFPIVFTIIDKMPTEQGFLYGKTLFNWAIVLIPKSILNGDYLISLWIKEKWYLGIEGGGLPPTAVGEWYANFGFSGVVVGMFVVGLALGTLYKLACSSESPYLNVLWANIVFGFVVIYPKTDLAQIPVFSIFVLFCLWLLMKVLQSGARHNVEKMVEVH
jgi:hypothetical protein